MSYPKRYESGMLRVSVPRVEPACVDFDCDHEHLSAHKAKANAAFLPHSCDEWVIGGAKEIRDLINDLKIALYAVEAKP